jgi:hypothetical protein
MCAPACQTGFDDQGANGRQAIHEFFSDKAVDARAKPGHDNEG